MLKFLYIIASSRRERGDPEGRSGLLRRLTPRNNNRGFTLFELIVTITIVALMIGLVVGRVGNFLETDMKKSSAKMAATMRYLYNKSITEGLYLRLVLDLGEQTYWVEATRDPFLMTNPNAETDIKVKKQEEEEEEDKDKDKDKEGEEAPVEEGESKLPAIKFKEATFSQVDSYLLRPTKLPDGIFFKDVMSEHQPTPVEGGKAGIHFFPNGYVEHAIINLKDEDDEINYSLETNPITGTVKVLNEYKAMEK
ncbi:MAG: prepilin-type N-terminal cleavage/methylation domain-containing protein [Pseudomonadota bacterium]